MPTGEDEPRRECGAISIGNLLGALAATPPRAEASLPISFCFQQSVFENKYR